MAPKAQPSSRFSAHATAKAGDIIIVHVGYSSYDYAALQKLIDILGNRDYSLLTIYQLLR